MHYVKVTVTNRLLGNGGEVWQEALLYSPVIRAQALSEPVPLQCELHKHFSVFLFPLR